MPEGYFPAMDEFGWRFSRAVERSGEKQEFLRKWGLSSLDEGISLFRHNVQGGYDSHRYCMLSADTGGAVLNVGPGMGFCVFLLAELYDRVLVAEPDRDNCRLLGHMARGYVTGRGKPASEIVEVMHAGFSITTEAARYWEAKQELLKRRKLHGSILNFTIRGAAELTAVLAEPVSRVYFHKVLSSFSISNTFGGVLEQAARCLSPSGVITWGEPGYIFSDIVVAGDEAGLESALGDAMAGCGLEFRSRSYPVTETLRQPPVEEEWTFIETWRKH